TNSPSRSVLLPTPTPALHTLRHDRSGRRGEPSLRSSAHTGKAPRGTDDAPIYGTVSFCTVCDGWTTLQRGRRCARVEGTSHRKLEDVMERRDQEGLAQIGRAHV